MEHSSTVAIFLTQIILLLTVGRLLGELMERIESTKDLSKDDEAKLHDAIKDFKKNATF